MEDNKLYALIWKAVAAVAVTLILSITSCQMHVNHKITEAVKAGADPVRASCAFTGNSQSTICVLDQAK